MSANVDNILNIKISQAFLYLYYFISCFTGSTLYSDPSILWKTACFLKFIQHVNYLKID